MSDEITLEVGGVAHGRWESYRVDANLLTPADAWELSLWAEPEDPCRLITTRLPPNVSEGAAVQLRLGGELILWGLIDAIDEHMDKQGHGLSISGRDLGSLLLDCSVPLLQFQQMTLTQVLKKAVALLGISKVAWLAEPMAPRQKLHTEPGQSVWDWLKTACEANGVWPWFAPDGTLVIGQPDYTAAPVADLVLRLDGQGNNVKRLSRHKSIHERHSEVTVLGQAAGDGDGGQHRVTGKATDATVPIFRPRLLLDGNCESIALAETRAKKVVADGRMAGERWEATVKGHRIIGTDGKPGSPWAPGVRVNLKAEPFGVDAVYYVIGRTFTLSRSGGQETVLKLIEDGSWVLNMPKVKGKRRRDYRKKNQKYAPPGGTP